MRIKLHSHSICFFMKNEQICWKKLRVYRIKEVISDWLAGQSKLMDHFMIRILLAEDDDVMREYLVRALTAAGYHVTDVDRGTAALPYLESGTFDLLLSDIVMPEMDGIELAQNAARVSPDTQIMFITGFAAIQLKAGETVPQAKLLSKPFHLKDLVAQVDALFADRKVSEKS